MLDYNSKMEPQIVLYKYFRQNIKLFLIFLQKNIKNWLKSKPKNRDFTKMNTKQGKNETCIFASWNNIILVKSS